MTDSNGRAELLEAYERLHRFGPEYGGDEDGNHPDTNHGPMAAEVIVRRGLDVAVGRWVDRYVPRLRELPEVGSPIEGRPSTALGDHRRLPDWRVHFRRELGERPWQDVVATWWPRLLPGLLAGATHGVIRVGHAVRALDAGDVEQARDELAEGLAFWAARWRPLDVRAGRGVAGRSAGPALEALPRLRDQSGYLAHRLDRLRYDGAWHPAAAAFSVPGDPDDVPAALAELGHAAAVRYLSTCPSAPVLLVHTTTAPGAVLHCLPHVSKELWRASLWATWTAVAALDSMYAVPSAPVRIRVGGPDPAGALLDRAGAHGDEHVLKLADAVVDIHARTGDDDVLAAGRLAARSIPSPY